MSIFHFQSFLRYVQRLFCIHITLKEACTLVKFSIDGNQFHLNIYIINSLSKNDFKKIYLSGILETWYQPLPSRPHGFYGILSWSRVHIKQLNATVVASSFIDSIPGVRHSMPLILKISLHWVISAFLCFESQNRLLLDLAEVIYRRSSSRGMICTSCHFQMALFLQRVNFKGINTAQMLLFYNEIFQLNANLVVIDFSSKILIYHQLNSVWRTLSYNISPSLPTGEFWD